MTYYYWKGVHANGKVYVGQQHAKSRRQARSSLATADITLLQIERAKLQASHLLQFTQQFSWLMSANIALVPALQLLVYTEKSKMLKTMLQQLQQHVESGMSLTQAMDYFPQLFSEEYRAFIEAGEVSGQLATSLNKLTQLLYKKQQIKNQLKKALSYPIFLLICTLIISLGIVLFIIPSYQHFFHEFGGKLPALTQLLLNITNTAQKYWALLTAITILLISLITITTRQTRTQQWLHKQSLKIPLVNSLILQTTLSQWSYLLAIATTSHIPLLTAITLANRAITNHYLAQHFKKIPSKLAAGVTLYDSLQAIPLLPTTTLQMIMIGENTGTLALIFSKIAQNHQEQLDEQLAKIIKYTEPFIMVLLALLMGIIIAALYLPMIHLGLNT